MGGRPEGSTRFFLLLSLKPPQRLGHELLITDDIPQNVNLVSISIRRLFAVDAPPPFTPPPPNPVFTVVGSRN
jgi:hypothetical protein